MSPTSPSTKRGVRLAGQLAAFAAILAGGVWLRQIALVDAFAKFQHNATSGDEVGIRLDDVRFWHYANGRLATMGRVDQIEVRRDRQSMQFSGIHEGRSFSTQRPMSFEANHAVWTANGSQIEADRGARVWGEGFDLAVERFHLDPELSLLRVPGYVSGKLGEGKVKAAALFYHLSDGLYSIGEASWEGKLPSTYQDEGGKRTWRVTAKKQEHPSEDLVIWDHATATDGDIIIASDRLEQHRKQSLLIATGKVSYYSTKTNIQCEKAEIYTKEKRAVFTGSVHMVFKPEKQQKKAPSVEEIPPYRPYVPDSIAQNRPAAPAAQRSSRDKELDDALQDPGTLRDYPMLAIADRIEYWYAKGSRHGKIDGAPQGLQELPGGRWRRLWADHAIYDGEAERLLLLSRKDKFDVHVLDSIGDDLTSTLYEVSTKDGDDWSRSGEITGDVQVEDSEIPKTKGQEKGGKPGPSGPAPGGPPKPIGGSPL